MDTDYNYVDFRLEKELPVIESFPAHNLKVGMRAPDGELIDLEFGSKVRLRELWREAILLIEFGSYT